MSAKRTTKVESKRQRALDMYVRGDEGPPVQSTVIASQLVDSSLESLHPEITVFGDDMPVSSEDMAEPADMVSGMSGDLDSGEVDTEAEIEPNPADGTEAAPAPADEELLLDAWHAEYSDPGQRLLVLQQQLEEESALEVVIGHDDRIRVTNVTAFPWRAICSLKITARDNSQWIGTGWLIGRRTVITAGHCVYLHTRGGWVSRVEVIPGRNGNERPFESCMATSFRSVIGWTEKKLRTHDYAAIILPEDCAYGDQLGFFGLANLSDQALNQLTVNLSGYPGDKDGGSTHWFHSRQLTGVAASILTYDIDTAGGQSGAPVWRLMNGQRHAVGIHTNGSVTGNSATRINKTVYDNLLFWKGQGD
jgi:glutamyl endopeptidase